METGAFGRKDPTIYRSGTKDNGEPIIKASSNQSVSSVKNEISANAEDFPIIDGNG
ncbi:hypothetical protein [Rhodohalobacter sulfatireducens]|uniref:hypothetical protein n=1 Tax=Rhodohalobacter sulfatireducens TaxID=2911366 RepID=UPI001EDA322B|nr:hypothetical protein [Rhodohalobacter sulfatireducens]